MQGSSGGSATEHGCDTSPFRQKCSDPLVLISSCPITAAQLTHPSSAFPPWSIWETEIRRRGEILLAQGRRVLSWSCFCASGELIHAVLMYDWVGNTTIFPANSAVLMRSAEMSELYSRPVICSWDLHFMSWFLISSLWVSNKRKTKRAQAFFPLPCQFEHGKKIYTALRGYWEINLGPLISETGLRDVLAMREWDTEGVGKILSVCFLPVLQSFLGAQWLEEWRCLNVHLTYPGMIVRDLQSNNLCIRDEVSVIIFTSDRGFEVIRN